jgi:hypothetical protein
LDGPAYDDKCQLVPADANFYDPTLTPHKRLCLLLVPPQAFHLETGFPSRALTPD